jgi:hypothetical protein
MITLSDNGAVNVVNAPRVPMNGAAGEIVGADDITRFIARVVPWPQEANGPGVVNLHWRLYDAKTGKIFWDGRPHRAISGFVRLVNWAKGQPKFQDLYFCTSLQSETGLYRHGKPTVKRDSKNALALRAIWLDIDVKDPPKGYTTLPKALQALAVFSKAYNLPPPTALVGSGGGVHVYWISNRDLTVDEWRPYAEGLKAAALEHGLRCDAGVTTDCARVLRVPDTYNYKTTPPKPVKLLGLAPNDLDFAAALSQLTAKAASSPRTVTATVTEKHDDTPLNAQRIFLPGGCAFFRDAFSTHGKGHSQPLWNLAILATTFMDNGKQIAHAISNGHSGYTKESTDAMYERKMRERQQKGLGWPGCAAFEGEGCKFCTACRHKGKIKSPLHLAPSNTAVGSVQVSDPNTHPWPNWTDPLDFHEVPIDEAIARINAAGYFVLTQNGDIYKIEPGGGAVLQKRQGFNNVFACRYARIGDDGRVSAGTAWISSRLRREYDAIGYWPDDHGRPPKAYNLWRSWGVASQQGDWSIIDDHILNVIANGDQAKANFILDWCAHMVQRPWEKPGVALVLRGRKGTGKSLLIQLLACVIGRENALITANGKRLFGQFNWHLADKLLIGAEEAFFVGNREQTDQLKHLLTGSDIEVEQKFGQRITMKSMHRVVMASNHDQVVAASDDERRFFVCDVSDKRRRNDPYFAPLVRVIEGKDDVTLAAFMHELKTRDIKNWKAEKAARQAASIDLARQKFFSLEPPLQWLLEQTEAAEPSLMPDAQCNSTRKWSRDYMLHSYREWAKKAQVRGATDFTGAPKFWASLKVLLNNEIFPGLTLFRASGGNRFVILPPRQDLLDGFNRLLGGKVVDVDDVPTDVASADIEESFTKALQQGIARAQKDLEFVRKTTSRT